MEKNYIENKILTQIINKDHQSWNKESIDLLIYVFEFEFLSDMHNLCLMLLKDYILWYKENLSLKCSESTMDKDLYKLEDLEEIYQKIDNNLIENKYENYVKYLKKKTVSKNDNNIKQCPFIKYDYSHFYIEDFIYDNFIWICIAILFLYFIIYGKEIKIHNQRIPYNIPIPISSPKIIEAPKINELFAKITENFNLEESLEKFITSINV